VDAHGGDPLHLAIPVIVLMERRFSFTVPLLLAASFAVYSIGPALLTQPILRDRTLYQFMALTPIAWGWMFGFGILAVKHFERLEAWIAYAPWAVVPILMLIQVGSARPMPALDRLEVGLASSISSATSASCSGVHSSCLSSAYRLTLATAYTCGTFRDQPVIGY